MSRNPYNFPPGNFWDLNWNRVPNPQYVNRGRGNLGSNSYRPSYGNTQFGHQSECWYYEDSFECYQFDANASMSPPTARQNSYNGPRTYSDERNPQVDRSYRDRYPPRGNHNARGSANRSLSRKPQPSNSYTSRDVNFHAPAASGSTSLHLSRIDSNGDEFRNRSPPNPANASSRNRESPSPKRRRGSDSGSINSNGLRRGDFKDHGSPRMDNISPRTATQTSAIPAIPPKIIPYNRPVDHKSSAAKNPGKDRPVLSSSRSVSTCQSSENHSSNDTPGPSQNSSNENTNANKETSEDIADLPDFIATNKRIRRDSGDSDKTEVITREKKTSLDKNALSVLKNYDVEKKKNWLNLMVGRIALTAPPKKSITIKQEVFSTPELSSSLSTTVTNDKKGADDAPTNTCEVSINSHQKTGEKENPGNTKTEYTKFYEKQNSTLTLLNEKPAAPVSERRSSNHSSSAGSTSGGRDSCKKLENSRCKSTEKTLVEAHAKPETAVKDTAPTNTILPTRSEDTVSNVKESSVKVTISGSVERCGSHATRTNSTTSTQQSNAKKPEGISVTSTCKNGSGTSKLDASGSVAKDVMLGVKQNEENEIKRIEEKHGEKSVSGSRIPALSSNSEREQADRIIIQSSSLGPMIQLIKKSSPERFEANKSSTKASNIPSPFGAVRERPNENKTKDALTLTTTAASAFPPSHEKTVASDSLSLPLVTTASKRSNDRPAAGSALVNNGATERSHGAVTKSTLPLAIRDIASAMSSSATTIKNHEDLTPINPRLHSLAAKNLSVIPLAIASTRDETTSQISSLKTGEPEKPLDGALVPISSSQNVCSNSNSSTAKSSITDSDSTSECVSMPQTRTNTGLVSRITPESTDFFVLDAAICDGAAVNKHFEDSKKMKITEVSLETSSPQKETLKIAPNMVESPQLVIASHNLTSNVPSHEPGQSKKSPNLTSDSGIQPPTIVSVSTGTNAGKILDSVFVQTGPAEQVLTSDTQIVLSFPENNLRNTQSTGACTLELSPVAPKNTEQRRSLQKIHKFKESAQKLEQLVQSGKASSKHPIRNPSQNEKRLSEGEDIVVLPNTVAISSGAGLKVCEIPLTENESSAYSVQPESYTKVILPNKVIHTAANMQTHQQEQPFEHMNANADVLCPDPEALIHSTLGKEDLSENLSSSSSTDTTNDKAQKLIAEPQHITLPSGLIIETVSSRETITTPQFKDALDLTDDVSVTQHDTVSSSPNKQDSAPNIQQSKNLVDIVSVEVNYNRKNCTGGYAAETEAEATLENVNIIEKDANKNLTSSVTMTHAGELPCETSIISAASKNAIFSSEASDPKNSFAEEPNVVSNIVPVHAQTAEDDEIQVIKIFDNSQTPFPRRSQDTIKERKKNQDRINELRQMLAQRDRSTTNDVATDVVPPNQPSKPPPIASVIDNLPIPTICIPSSQTQTSSSRVDVSMPPPQQDIVMSALEASGTSFDEDMVREKSDPKGSSDSAIPSSSSLENIDHSPSRLRIVLTPPSIMIQSATNTPLSATGVMSHLVSEPESTSNIRVSHTSSLVEQTITAKEQLQRNDKGCASEGSKQISTESYSEPDFYPVMSILDAPRVETSIQCEIWKEDKVCSSCQSAKCWTDKSSSECASRKLCFPPNREHYKTNVAGHSESMRRCVEEINSHLKDWNDDGTPEEVYEKLKIMYDKLRFRSHSIECRMAGMEAAQIVPSEILRAQPVDGSKLMSVEDMREYFIMLLQIEDLLRMPESQATSNNAYTLKVLRFRILRILNYYCRQTPGAKDSSILNLLASIEESPEYKEKFRSWSVEKLVACWDAVKRYEGELDKVAIVQDFSAGTKKMQRTVDALFNKATRERAMAQRAVGANTTAIFTKTSTAATTASGQYLQQLVVSPVTPSPPLPLYPSGTSNTVLQHVSNPSTLGSSQFAGRSSMIGDPPRFSQNPISSVVRTVLTPAPQQAPYVNQINQTFIQQTPNIRHSLPSTRILSPAQSRMPVQMPGTTSAISPQSSVTGNLPGAWKPIPGAGVMYRLVPNESSESQANIAPVAASQMFTAGTQTNTARSQRYSSNPQSTESAQIRTTPLTSPSSVSAHGVSNFPVSAPNATVQRGIGYSTSAPHVSPGQQRYYTLPTSHQPGRRQQPSTHVSLPQGTNLIPVQPSTALESSGTGMQQKISTTQGYQRDNGYSPHLRQHQQWEQNNLQNQQATQKQQQMLNHHPVQQIQNHQYQQRPQ